MWIHALKRVGALKLLLYTFHNKVILIITKNYSPRVKELISDSFPHSSAGKESAYNAKDPTLITESGSTPGERHSNPL